MDTWLVVGLGNPGPNYAGNRHNVGAMVVDELASRHDLGSLTVERLASRRARAGGAADGAAAFKVHKARARVVETRLRVPGPKLVLAVPLTYMNVSGGPVAGLLKYFDVPVERLIVAPPEEKGTQLFFRYSPGLGEVLRPRDLLPLQLFWGGPQGQHLGDDLGGVDPHLPCGGVRDGIQD